MITQNLTERALENSWADGHRGTFVKFRYSVFIYAKIALGRSVVIPSGDVHFWHIDFHKQAATALLDQQSQRVTCSKEFRINSVLAC